MIEGIPRRAAKLMVGSKLTFIFSLLIENWPHVTFLEKNLIGFAFPI